MLSIGRLVSAGLRAEPRARGRERAPGPGLGPCSGGWRAAVGLTAAWGCGAAPSSRRRGGADGGGEEGLEHGSGEESGPEGGVGLVPGPRQPLDVVPPVEQHDHRLRAPAPYRTPICRVHTRHALCVYMHTLPAVRDAYAHGICIHCRHVYGTYTYTRRALPAT
jgi:hypothetical protein